MEFGVDNFSFSTLKMFQLSLSFMVSGKKTMVIRMLIPLYTIFGFSLATRKIHSLSLAFIHLIMMGQAWFSSHLASLVSTKFWNVFAIIKRFFLPSSLLLGQFPVCQIFDTVSQIPVALVILFSDLCSLSSLDQRISSGLFTFAHFFSVFSMLLLSPFRVFFPKYYIFGLRISFIFYSF